MSDTNPSPRPGTAAAFKQRHEAYQIASSIRDDLNDARYDLNLRGEVSQAVAKLEGILKRVESNPEAQRMLAERLPGALDLAKGLHQNAKAEVPFEVRTTGGSAWHTRDGQTETRLQFGRSQQGHHFRMDVATLGYEREVGWSQPFRTEAIARAAGQAREAREHGGVVRHQEPNPTPRGRHAEVLKLIAEARLSARAAGKAVAQASPDRQARSPYWEAQKAESIRDAQHHLKQARQIRGGQERSQSRGGGHER